MTEKYDICYNSPKSSYTDKEIVLKYMFSGSNNVTKLLVCVFNGVKESNDICKYKSFRIAVIK